MNEDANWYFFKRLDYCHELTNRDLMDSPLARKAISKGYPSLTSLLNSWNCWNCTVSEIDTQLNEQSHDKEV